MTSCGEVREMLPAYLDEPGASLAVRRHLARCDECRAELARYESLAAQLPALVLQTAEPPAYLLDKLVSIPTGSNSIEAVRTHVARNRSAYVGAAVLVAGAAAGAVWRTRRRLVTA